MRSFLYHILFLGAIVLFLGQSQSAHALSITWSGPSSFNNHTMSFTPVNDVSKITINDTITEQAFGHDHGGSTGVYTEIKALYTDDTWHNIFSMDISAGKSFQYGGLVIDLPYSPDIKELKVWSSPDQDDTFHRWNGVSFDFTPGPPTSGSVPEPVTINLKEVKIKFKDNPNNDEFEVKGVFVLGEGNNGIDPIVEDVIVNVGASILVIPAPYSFVEEEAGVFKYKGVINSTYIEMKIKARDIDTFKFKIKTKGIDLTGTPNPVEIELNIGDDVGKTNIRLKGELKFTSSMKKCNT